VGKPHGNRQIGRPRCRCEDLTDSGFSALVDFYGDIHEMFFEA
jgi:hypothetical protein